MFNNKKEFFVWWIKNVFESNYTNPSAIYRKRNILVLFAYTKLREYSEPEQFVGNIVTRSGEAMFIDEQGALQPLPIYEPDETNLQPWFKSDEELTLTEKDCNLVVGTVKTTYGEALMNLLILGTTFLGKAKYVSNPTGWLDVKHFIKAFEKIPRAEDPLNPKEGETTPREYWRFIQALGWIQWMNPLFGVAATEDTLTVPKEVKELANKLLAQAEKEGKLEDAVYMANLEKQVIELDKKIMATKPGAMFLKGSDKNHGVSRKRMFIMFGTEASIEAKGKVVTVKQPLTAGLDLEHLPEQANSMRAGISGRGLGTALGGAGAKKASRATQDIAFNIDDCGSKVPAYIMITDANASYLKGRYLMGTTKPIEEGETDKYIGKIVALRSPITCKGKVPNFCKVCMGKTASRMENSAALQAMTKENVVMYHEMKKMHASVVKTTLYDLFDCLH